MIYSDDIFMYLTYIIISFECVYIGLKLKLIA
jgi:hypothetical protein